PTPSFLHLVYWLPTPVCAELSPKMNFETYISTYMDVVDYPEWSLLGLLQYLETRVEYTSASLQDIINIFMDLLDVKSKSRCYLKSTRRRAEKLCSTLNITKTRSEVQRFLQKLDLKHAQSCYATDIELNVTMDKSATIELTSANYVASVQERLQSTSESQVHAHDNEVSNNSVTDVDDMDVGILEPSTPSPLPKRAMATETLLITPQKRPLENEIIQRFTDNLPLICAFGMSSEQLVPLVGSEMAQQAKYFRSQHPSTWTPAIRNYLGDAFK
ncbi:636_t:CDS:2, partial [Paraglomus occultum]